MTSNSEPQGFLQPLSVGNVVSAGLRLYSSHFQQYARVALFATLWILVPFLIAVPIILFFAVIQDYYGLLALIIPAWIGLLLYCIAKYMAGSAAIARLAFGELTQRPETPEQARRFTNSRMWWFWLVTLLLSLIYGGVTIAFYILLTVLIVIAVAVIGGTAMLQTSPPEAFLEQMFGNPEIIMILGLGFLGLLALFFTFFCWFAARFSVAEIPLAIEAEMDAAKSIGRSWQLTQKNAWRIFLILFVTALITVPVQFLTQLAVSVVDGIAGTLLPQNSSAYTLLSLTFTYILSFAVSILIVPLWQSIKAVIYYDLRSRREGLGLQLRNSSSCDDSSAQF
jgi:hypothetical protein